MATRIYIVEDHEVMRQMLSRFLVEEAGFEVAGRSATAEEALGALGETKLEVDLALVDLSLPGMDGIALVDELQERRPELPCVILSGHAESVYVERALEAGAQGYILKGDPYELEGAIGHVLGGDVYLSEPHRRSQP